MSTVIDQHAIILRRPEHETTPMPTHVDVTTRTRNLGYAVYHRGRQDEFPSRPEVTGGLAAIERAATEARREHGKPGQMPYGWTGVLFVDGQAVDLGGLDVETWAALLRQNKTDRLELRS